MQFVVNRDIEESRRLVWAVNRRKIRRLWILAGVLILVTALVVAVGAVSVYRGVPDPLPAWTGGVAGGSLPWCVLLFVSPLLSVRRTARRIVTQSAGNATVFSIDTAQVGWQTGGISSQVSWEAIRGAQELDGFLVLRDVRSKVLTTMCHHCMGASNVMEMRMFLVGRGLLPQTYKI